MEEILFNFSRLFSLLHSTCEATTTACQALDKNCYDCRNVLKSWLLPEDKETFECTCKPYLNNEDEIVHDIVSAVEKARETRRNFNDVKTVEFSKNYNVKDVSKKLGNSVRQIKQGKSSGALRKICDEIGKGILEAKDPENSSIKTQSRKSVNNTWSKTRLLQTTYQKDFFVRNSQSFSQTQKQKKEIKNHVKVDEVYNLSTCFNLDLVGDACHLISSNCSIKRKTDLKMDFVQNLDKNMACFVHGNTTLLNKQQCVPLKEALDILGVPPELLKLLKQYHQFVSINSSHHFRPASNKNSFLEKLSVLNKNRKQISSEPIIKLWLHYFLIFGEVHSLRKCELEGTLHGEFEEELDALLAKFKTNNNSNTSVILSTQKLFMNGNTLEKWQWALAGVWNRKCWTMFSDLKNSLKVFYSNHHDCMLLQKRILEIQKLCLQLQILELLKTDIFPLLSNLSYDDVPLSSLYKSFYTLSNISSLSIPVLLKY